MNDPRKAIEQKANVRRCFRQLLLDHNERPTAETMILLRELSRFCYANKPTAKISPRSGNIDPLAMAIAEGRREVFLYILNILNTDDAVFDKLLTQYHQQEIDP